MEVLKAILWSAVCIALGIALASVEVHGKTPWGYVRAATEHTPKLDGLKGDVENAVEVAKRKLSTKPAAPTEKHTESERDAVNQLVARTGKR